MNEKALIEEITKAVSDLRGTDALRLPTADFKGYSISYEKIAKAAFEVVRPYLVNTEKGN